MKTFVSRILAVLLGVAIGAPVPADDSEIFMVQYGATGASSGRPKVLILFDNSGSMRNGIPQAKADFDPDKDWTQVPGAPGNFRTDRLYWSYDGNPPGTSTDRYVPVASNRCATSLTPLQQTGRYTDYLRAWRDEYQCVDWEWRCTRRRHGTCHHWREVCVDYDQVDIWDTVADNNDTRGTSHMECAADIDDGDPTNPGTTIGWASNSDGPFRQSAVGYPWDSWHTRHDGDTTRTLFTGSYLAWYYNDSLIDNRTKMEIAKDVISDLVANNPQIDFGLMLFNYNGNDDGDGDYDDDDSNDKPRASNKHGGRVVSHLDRMSEQDRSDFVALVNSLSPETWTPLCETYYEAFRYLAQPDGTPMSVYYGDEDPDRRPYRDACAEASNDAGSCWNDGTYDSPMGDCEQVYLIMMTDGRPTYDLHANSLIKNLPGITDCDNYKTDHGGAYQENCLPKLARYLYESDLDDTWQNGDQRVVTYTIGFLTDQKLLRDAAENGGGTYYTAENAHTLADAFQATLTEILSSNTTFTAPAVAVDAFNRTRSLDDLYIAMFRPEIKPRWRGNLKKLEINDDGEVLDANGVRAIDPISGRIKDTATTFWTQNGIDGMEVDEGGAGERLIERDPAGRVIKTNTGLADDLEDFAMTNPNLTSEMLDAVDDAQLALFVNWTRGVDVLDEDDDDDTTDTRPWIMGDVMHSRPLAINYGNPNDPSAPDVRVVFGTNAGLLHMIDGDDGEESWAFFPKELGTIVPTLVGNNPDHDHPYGVDGSPTALLHDADEDGSIVYTDADGDFAYLYFGLRRGGEQLYALDITRPDNPQILWRTSAADHGELAQTWAAPVATQVPGHANPVIIVGAGYDTNKDIDGVGTSDDEGRGIFVFDAIDGSLVWSITPAEDSSTNRNVSGLTDSVPAAVTVHDSDGDLRTDRIYFPDTGGNIWRADLVGSDKSNWTVFKLADLGGDAAASDRRFLNRIDLGATRYGTLVYDALAIGSGNRAHPLERDVQDRFYVIRDYQTRSLMHVPNDNDPDTDACASAQLNPDGLPCSEIPSTITEADLYDVTANLIQDGNAEQQAAAQTALSSIDTLGWMLDFERTGEKSLSRSITLKGRLFFTTYVPPDPLDPDVEHICRPSEGKGFLYAVGIHDAQAVYDWATPLDRVLTKADRNKKIKDNIPDYPVAHFGDPWIRLVGVGPGTDGKGSEDTGLTLTNQAIYWYQDAH